jgi:hypothetical protein
MNRTRHLLCAAALLAACAPPAPQAPAADAPQPSPELAAVFPGCEWGEVSAAGVSVWSFACPDQRLIADVALPGFQLELGGESETIVRVPAIRFFAKAPDAPLESVLEAVRAASPGGEACTIEPGSHGDYVLMPTGDALVAYQAFVEGRADGPSMPCGPLGPSEAGGRTFRVLDGAPDKVVMINWPSDVAIFDSDTLRVTQ